MKNLCAFALLFLLTGLTAAPAAAFSLGNNITIYDGNATSESWYGSGEDQEVEPGMVKNQVWDLEAFFIDSENILSLSGGFNFSTGVEGHTSGDIFIAVIDTENDVPAYGDIHRTGSDGNTTHIGSYGYDFVLDLDFETDSYQVYQLDETSVLQTAYYRQNEGSSPWQYNAEDNDDTALLSGSFDFLDSNLPAEVTDFTGRTHYLLTGFDLSFLGHGTEFYSHYTMGCGNDNLMGSGVVVPEPGTWILLGSGLMILALVRRRKV